MNVHAWLGQSKAKVNQRESNVVGDVQLNEFFLSQQVFLHAERKTCELSSQSEENEKPVTAKLSLPGDQRAYGRRPGRRGRSRGSRVHAQPCKQLSYHPAPGKVHKVVRHMEGSGSCGRRAPLQHRLSVAQLADAALVVSRTKEFEGQMNPEISKKHQLPSSLPCSRSRRVVRQASVDMDPSSIWRPFLCLSPFLLPVSKRFHGIPRLKTHLWYLAWGNTFSVHCLGGENFSTPKRDHNCFLSAFFSFLWEMAAWVWKTPVLLLGLVHLCVTDLLRALKMSRF